MLILQRHSGQSIWVGDDIQIIVLGHSRGITRLGINAPPGLTIFRDEVKRQVKPKERAKYHE